MIYLHILAGVIFLASGWVLGVFSYRWYQIYRVRKSIIAEGGDDSNLYNAMRIVDHVTLHAMDFGRMYYVSKEGVIGKRCFPYIFLDEFSEVVKTRP